MEKSRFFESPKIRDDSFWDIKSTTLSNGGFISELEFLIDHSQNLSDLDNNIQITNNNQPEEEIQIFTNVQQNHNSFSLPSISSIILPNDYLNNEELSNNDSQFLNKKRREDNLRRKFVNNGEKYILEFINDKIKIANNEHIIEDKIEKLNPIYHDKSYYKIENLKKLQNFTIKEIFNKPLNNNFTKTSKDSNEKVIEKIENNKDKSEKVKVIFNIFEKTFTDVFKYYINYKNYKNNSQYFCLKGFEKKKIFKKTKDEQAFLLMFEEKIKKVKSRKSKKKK